MKEQFQMSKHLLFVLVALCSIGAAKAAPPALGPDCGIGATVVGDKTGDKYAAGKVTLGAYPPGTQYALDSCTLTWLWSKVPSCSAMLETPIAGQSPKPYGTSTTTTTLVISVDDYGPLMQPGYVVSYLCVGQ